MVKRTMYFGNPAYLNLKDEQMEINIPESDDVKNEIRKTIPVEDIDWNNIAFISKRLFIVKDMNPSLNKIIFQQFYKADAISISEADAKSLFKNPDLKEQKEEIKYGVIEMMQYCIKVFTDKLGKKIVPYWEFKNGCWDKERAKELGIIV